MKNKNITFKKKLSKVPPHLSSGNITIRQCASTLMERHILAGIILLNDLLSSTSTFTN